MWPAVEHAGYPRAVRSQGKNGVSREMSLGLHLGGSLFLGLFHWGKPLLSARKVTPVDQEKCLPEFEIRHSQSLTCEAKDKFQTLHARQGSTESCGHQASPYSLIFSSAYTPLETTHSPMAQCFCGQLLTAVAFFFSS